MPATPERTDFIPDDRNNNYRAVGDVLAHVALKCGIEVDDTTHARWRDTMGLLREFDTFADEDCTSRSEALPYLRDFSLFAPRYPAVRPDVLGPELANTVFEHTETILELGDRIAEETDIEQFIQWRMLEAYYTVKILGAVATDHVQSQSSYNLCLWRFMGLGIGANLADSFIDARTDYATGKQLLEPSAQFYRRVGYESLHHAKPHARTVLDLGGLKLRAKMVARRIAHRATHGITPNSNLHLVKALWRRHPTN